MNALEHLVFRLFGPFASWGEVAVGNHRPTAEAPTRSGLLGLIAAAFGIERADATGLRQLATSLQFAVEVRHPGTPLTDYHTAQTRHVRAGTLFATRREELEVEGTNLETILTAREYRTCASYVVALWPKDGTARDLHEVRSKLESPVFAPYLGRRSCVLAHPLAPTIVQAATLADALAVVPWDERLDGDAGAPRWAWTEAHPDPGMPIHDRIARWDDPAGYGDLRTFRPREAHRTIRRPIN